jgi:hypothetical protein
MVLFSSPWLDVTAIDIAPALPSVLTCDFLSVPLTDATVIKGGGKIQLEIDDDFSYRLLYRFSLSFFRKLMELKIINDPYEINIALGP